MREPKCPSCQYPESECACFDDYDDDEIAASYDRHDDDRPRDIDDAFRWQPDDATDY